MLRREYPGRHHARPRLPDEWLLQPRDRQVLGLEDFTDADIAVLEQTRAPDSAKAFDHELKPARVQS